MYDKTSVEAVRAQAFAVYLLFDANLLFVTESSRLANFPAIQDYPETDESQAIASLARASLWSLFSIEVPSDAWARSFWNQGLAISPCTDP